MKNLLILTALLSSVAYAAPNAEALYDTHCLSCHAPNRLGGMGPTLLPESLARLKRPEAIKAIADGLPATQMPGFKDLLKPDEISALADFIYTPPTHPPKWDAADITASRIVHQDALTLPAKPVFKADPMNITLVVEHGDHHITVLDGDIMEPIVRFPTRYALHGGPKFTPDGRFVYWATRDGWITKFDLWNLTVVAETRVGINTRNVAVASDGKTVLAANYLPHTLVKLDARDLSLIEVIPVIAANGKSSRVSAVYDARPRNSYIAALKDIPEVWEIPYDGRPPRPIVLQDHLDDFFFDPGYAYILGASRSAPKGQVIHLDSGRKIAELDLGGMPHLGSGITWDWKDSNGQTRRVMASPNLKDGLVTVIDMQTWQPIKTIPTAGPGFFLRSHEASPYAWADVFFGKHRDVMHVIDKQSLKIVADLKPIPGQTATHVEFDRYGKFALVSIWEMDGALIVYDAKTLKEIKRLPMKRPVGKYNVWNKTRLSEGTSH
ncbi:MAG: cytochrome C oxidase Cbb3 [Betaproteobacteria bacterium]|jgi:DNA-binding beta-propeller fold protein YncE/cytochrome c553|nr:MAG: cytochrome C oxidase Cbb3 [Betaproteobacteria bacterium]